MHDELTKVIANWLRQADDGGLPDGVRAEDWVAARVFEWIDKHVLGEAADELQRAEISAAAVRRELLGQGGWERFGEALHELNHIEEAVAFVKAALARE